MFYKILLVLTLSFCCLSAKNIEVLVPISYNYSGSTANVIQAGAALELAAEGVQEKYGSSLNMSIRHLFSPSTLGCEEVAGLTAYKTAEYFYKNVREDTCYALVQNGEKKLRKT